MTHSRWPSLADVMGRFAFVLIRTADDARVLDAYASAILNGTVDQLLFLEQRGRPTSNLVIFNEAGGDSTDVSASTAVRCRLALKDHSCSCSTQGANAISAAVDRGMIVRAFAGSKPDASRVASLLKAGVQHITSDVVPGGSGDGAALRDVLLANGMSPRCLARCAAAGGCADLTSLCSY